MAKANAFLVRYLNTKNCCVTDHFNSDFELLPLQTTNINPVKAHFSLPVKLYESLSRFLIQKNHQFIFAALFEFLRSQIFHRKKLDDFSAANLTKITTNVKKGEVGLIEQRSFLG